MSKINQAFTTLKELLLQRVTTIKNPRIMKMITFFLLTVFCLHAGTGAYSQNVTMTVKNEPLIKVFAEIQKQTGYGFVYRAELLDDTKSVDLEVKQASIREVLDICFKDQPLTYNIVDKTIIISKKDKTQNATDRTNLSAETRGRIVNEKGEPVVATIRVKETDPGDCKIASLAIPSIRRTIFCPQ